MNGNADHYVDFFRGGEDDDSDPEASGSGSSDSEIDMADLFSPSDQSRLPRRRHHNGDKSSSEDEFEKEMNAELNAKVKTLERRRRSLSADSAPQQGTSGQAGSEHEPQKYYDDVYFDSDEEEMCTEGDARCKRKQLTDDDLLYDPDIDNDNEKWVQKQRQQCVPKTGDTKSTENRLPSSDAVLNCPACMTTLCLDCQRHDVYKSQYRAMFVKNCKIDKSERLKYPITSEKICKRRKKQKTSAAPADPNQDQFNPVKCTECSTLVAVYSDDEIYHFFNVLASY